mgnify:CR=1 FL=1
MRWHRGQRAAASALISTDQLEERVRVRGRVSMMSIPCSRS